MKLGKSCSWRGGFGVEKLVKSNFVFVIEDLDIFF